MANVLLTGCTGFIGSQLAQRLLEDEHTVYGLVRHTTRRDFAVLGNAVESMRFIEGDVADYHSLQSAIESCAPQIVIHLAALTPVRLSFDDPLPYMRVNFLGTTNLVHAVLERTPNAKVIFASSAEVYGWQPQEPTKENARFYPSSPYGVSKAAADTYIQMAMRVYGLRAVVFRCNNTYGRTGDSNFLTEYAINAMIHGKPIYIGAPTHVRDYMHVDDHVNAYLLAVKNDSSIGNVFNVSPGNPTSNLELVKNIADLVKYKGKIVEGTYPPGYPRRPSDKDTEYIVLDSSKIRNQLDWKPTKSLREGLLGAIEAWRKV
jgi:nucleoside-diphosphate-sugar epimerase